MTNGRCCAGSLFSPATGRSQRPEPSPRGGEVCLADIVDLLSQLVEKSLVVLEPQGERYRMLDTVREYAQERLRESAEDADIRTRHLNFYLDLAEKARPELVGPNQGTWLKRLDLERENFLAANAWCDTVEEGSGLGLELGHALKRYWLNRGLLGLGHRLSVGALACAGADGRA